MQGPMQTVVIEALRHQARVTAILAGRHVRRTALAGLGLTIVALSGVAAAGCAVAALWIATAPSLGPAGAALLSSASLLGFGLGLLAWLQRKMSRPVPMRVAVPPLQMPGLAAAFHTNKATLLVAAIAAGLVAGDTRRGS